MKTINIPLEDSEYDLLCQARGDESKSWKDYFLDTARDRIALNEAAEEIIEGDLRVTGDILVAGNIRNTNDGDDE